MFAVHACSSGQCKSAFSLTIDAEVTLIAQVCALHVYMAHISGGVCVCLFRVSYVYSSPTIYDV